MRAETFEGYTTKKLIERKKLSTIALLCAWIGGTIGSLVVIFKWIFNGQFETTLFIISITTIILSPLVHSERRAISEIIDRRNKE